MSDSRKKFIVDLCIGGMVAVLVYSLNADNPDRSWIHLLCDACFVPAVMLLGCGGIIFCTNQGVFDVMGYGIKDVFTMMLPGRNSYDALRERETFLEYQERKQKNRRSPKEILLAGLVYLVLALVLFVVYLIIQ